MSSIWLRRDAYRKVALRHGHTTYRRQAAAAGLGFGTLWRTRNGAPVSSETVAALLNLYGLEFSELFSIGREPVREQVPA